MAQARPSRLRCTESIRLVEDEESLREEEEERRQIRLHLLHNGFTEEAKAVGNVDWRADAAADEPVERLTRTKGRRSGNNTAVSGFAKDVINGLESDTFSLGENIDSKDERRGLDDDSAAEIAEYMRKHRCSFDDARLEMMRNRMREAGVDPDTGLPLDPKALLPEDHCPPPSFPPPKSPKLSMGSMGAVEQPNGAESTRLSAARQLISKMWGGGNS